MHAPTLSTDLFTYLKLKSTFVAESSDLQWDRIPTMLYLRSARTGRIVRFEADHALRDSRENETLAYVYGVSAEENDGLSPNLYGLQVVVYND